MYMHLWCALDLVWERSYLVYMCIVQKKNIETESTSQDSLAWPLSLCEGSAMPDYSQGGEFIEMRIQGDPDSMHSQCRRAY